MVKRFKHAKEIWSLTSSSASSGGACSVEAVGLNGFDGVAFLHSVGFFLLGNVGSFLLVAGFDGVAFWPGVDFFCFGNVGGIPSLAAFAATSSSGASPGLRCFGGAALAVVGSEDGEDRFLRGVA